MIAHRKAKGSTSFLVSLLIGIIVFVALCGIGFNYLLFMRARAQYAADAMALNLATKINVGDRVGQFNQLQEASRELVFVSRQYCDQCNDKTFPTLTSLCNRLVEDARSAHSLVEDERQNQIVTIRKEAQDAALTCNKQRNDNRTFAFFGLNCFEPEILRVDLGRIANVSCNVRSLDAISDLANFDLSKGYFDKKTKLFKSDINAKLPESDADLDFNFSSLPAYIDKISAPPRNTNDRVFIRYNTVFDNREIKNTLAKQIPSAIQVHYGMDVIVPWDQSRRSPVGMVATGSSSGATEDSQ
jgi:hypothetical protein